MKEEYTHSKYESFSILCQLFGHKKIVVNDIIDPFSKDRFCIRCKKCWFYDDQANLITNDL